MSKQLATTLFSFLVAACTASSEPADRGTVATAEPLVQPAAPVTPVSGDWRTRVRAHVAELRAADPELHAELAQLAPAQTRAGLPRFTSSTIHDPRATAVFLDRLINSREAEPTRAALVEALPRTGGLYADAVVDLIGTEVASSVRSAYVHSIRRAPATEAIRVLALGLADADPLVTAEAARSAAAHPQGAQVGDQLRAALAHTDATTRAEAARALGVLRVTSAREALRPFLVDPSADVRLEALRAIDRIAPGSMAGDPSLTALGADADPRIVQLVAKLSGRASTATP